MILIVDSGDVSKTGGKTEVNMGIKSYLMDTTLVSTYRSTDKMSATKVKVNYSIMERPKQSVEVSTKYNRIKKGSLNKVSVAGVVQGTQFPQLSTDFSWDYQTSDNFMENSVRLSMGNNQWNIKQSFSNQYRNSYWDWNAGLSVVCLEQNIDFLVQGIHKSNDTSFLGQTIVRLSPSRQWSALVDIVRQIQPLHYGGHIELNTPTGSRQLSASIIETMDQKQWNVSFDYELDKQTDTSVTVSYKNVNDNAKVSFVYSLFLLQ